jgi:hypothetical protein
MNDIEQRVQAAFAQLSVPPGLKERTLDAIHEREGGEQTGPVLVGSITPAAARKRRPVGRIVTLLAACLTVIALGVGGYTAYATPVAYIQVEVNPSVELGVNRFDRVVQARGLNSDGQVLLGNVHVEGMKYDAALETLFGSPEFVAYVGSASLVELSITADDAAQQEAILRSCDVAVANLPCEGVCHVASSQQHDAAHAQGMGVARYQAAQELLLLDPGLTMDDCRTMTMRELRERIAAAQQGGVAQSRPGNGAGHGRGHG